jgi:hypothetical protein
MAHFDGRPRPKRPRSQLTALWARDRLRTQPVSQIACFDSLAQFYRRAYLRYIDGTKRRPDVRAARIAEVVGLLAAGVKERPKA